MQTVFIIAVTCALAIGHDASDQPVDQCALRVALVLASISIPCLTAKMVILVCGDLVTNRTSESARVVARWERMLLGVWILVAAFLVYVADWVTIVRTNWGWGDSILGDELLIILPLLAPWLVSWAVLFELEWCESTAISTRRAARIGFVWRLARIVIGLGLVPILATCLLADTVRLLAPGVLDSPWSVVVYAIPLVLVLLAYPYLLMVMWRMRPLEAGARRTRLVDQAARAGVSIRDILVWDTDGQITNAATSGALRRFRFVFFTDRLLETASEAELNAVFLHELAHASYQHVTHRALALLLPFSTIVVGANASRILHGELWTSASPPLDGITYIGLAGTCVFMAMGLGWYSRMLEHQADLWACQQMRRDGIPDAVECYLRVLLKMHDDLPSDGSGWLHPGWPARRDFLRHSLSDPRRTQAFSRLLNGIGVVTRSVFAMAVVLTIAACWAG